MKRWLCFMLAAMLLMVSLGGCGGSSSGGGGGQVWTDSGDSESAGSDSESADSGDNSNTEAGERIQEILADEETQFINLSSITTSGTVSTQDNVSDINEYTYAWHVDYSSVVLNEDSELYPYQYYTGTKPNGESIYVAHDIRYFPTLDTSGFSTVNYDGENEYGFYYTASGYTDKLFATLPAQGKGYNSLPTAMMHTATEAYNNPVLHITKPGAYVLSGTWNGQVWINLDTVTSGTKNKNNEDAHVDLVLNGVSVNCTVAPSLVIQNTYECGPDDNTTYDVDISEAGVNVYIVDGTTNSFTGANVYRILRPVDKTASSGVKQEKVVKIDGAFYSYRSMNVYGDTKGTGKLNIVSSFEGLDTELHMLIHGGIINIVSSNDCINVNEDDISVVTVEGGTLSVQSDYAGDGIDSNGWIVVKGGTITSIASGGAEEGFDAEKGVYVSGGNITTNTQINNLTQTGGTITYTNDSGGGTPGDGGGPGDGGTPPDGEGPGGGGTPPSGGPGGN